MGPGFGRIARHKVRGLHNWAREPGRDSRDALDSAIGKAGLTKHEAEAAMYNIHHEADATVSRRSALGGAPCARPQREDDDFRVGPAGRARAVPRTPGGAHNSNAELRGNSKIPRESCRQ